MENQRLASFAKSLTLDGMKKLFWNLIIFLPSIVGVLIGFATRFLLDPERYAGLVATFVVFCFFGINAYWLKVSKIEVRLWNWLKLGRCCSCGADMVRCKCPNPIPRMPE